MAKGNELDINLHQTNHYMQFCRLQPSVFDAQHTEGLLNRSSPSVRLPSSPDVARNQPFRKQSRTQVAWSVITAPITSSQPNEMTKETQMKKLNGTENFSVFTNNIPSSNKGADVSNNIMTNKDNQTHLNLDLKTTFRDSQVINIQLNPLTRNAKRDNSLPDLPRGSNSYGFYMSSLNNNPTLPLSAKIKSNAHHTTAILPTDIKPLSASSSQMEKHYSYKERILIEEAMLKLYDRTHQFENFSDEDLMQDRRDIGHRSRKNKSVSKSQSKYISSSFPYSPLNSKFFKHQSKLLQSDESQSQTKNGTILQRINSSSCGNITNATATTSRNLKPRHAGVKYRVSFAKATLNAQPNTTVTNSNTPMVHAANEQWPPILTGSKLRPFSHNRSQSARPFQDSVKMQGINNLESTHIVQYLTPINERSFSPTTDTYGSHSSDTLAHSNQVVPHGNKILPQNQGSGKRMPPSFRINSHAVINHKVEKETTESPEEIIMRKSVEKVKRWIEKLPIHFQAIHHVLPPVQQDY